MRFTSYLMALIASVTVAVSFANAKPPKERMVAAGDSVDRGLKICVAADAPPEVREAAQMILAAGVNSPLMQAMSGDHLPTSLTASAELASASAHDRAFNHLILVGMPTDPLITQAWQHEAQVQQGGFYIFGFGNLSGDIGYLEADRNPFLHGIAISAAPFETEVVTITGSTPAGVKLAAQAFVREGLVNGVVAGPGWKRGEPTLLDHDPLVPDFELSAEAPQKLGSAPRIAVTQASEDEYRGVLADTGISPVEIWRAKYFVPGAWDGAGQASAIDDYLAGLHRRAYGNTLWIARFATADQAAKAAPKIAAAAKLSEKGNVWSGKQPSAGKEGGAGDLKLWHDGEYVVMSTLPAAFTNRP